MSIVPTIEVFAIDFNNGYIISDSDLTDDNSMDLSEINAFLKNKNSALASKNFINKDGETKSAAEIIWQATLNYKVNPKFLLVLLQKEQSIIEDGTPTQKQFDWAMGYGVCDACDPDEEGLLIFKGFGTQVDRAAWRQRWYIDNKEINWLKKAGQSYVIDGYVVIIANQATANLYNYTPHIQGNYLFWKIWNRWFTQKYADSSLLQVEGEAGVWLIQYGEKRPFLSKSAFLSRYNFQDIIKVSKTELDKYELGNPIKFPNYSLLKTPMGNSYLLVNDELRKFESAKVTQTLGFNPEEFVELSLDDFSDYQIGEPITLASAFPAGALLQDRKTGGVYFAQDGKKYPIPTKDILKINFPQYHITSIAPAELEKYPTQESIKIKDGVLVKTVESPAVYVISERKKRPIASAKVFERLGYKWENIVTVAEKSLENLEPGATIDLEFGK
ncbi:hypothetical protein HZB94_02690 [Candidatus Falkowbacteria bacterium]|nr:hypothetical protein [Candidatus Falkowbacteria bacterium]